MEFYNLLNRRPLIEIVPDEGEVEFWSKEYKNSNDITLYSWRNDWVNNTRENLKHFGYFNRDNSIKIYFNELINEPVILVGAGSSLEKNIEYLKLAKEMKIPIISSHHSLMYLADYGIKPDYVVVLDAGKMWDDYFAFDKMDWSDVPLLADQTCNTEQLKKWPGKVKFFKSTNPVDTNIGKFIKMELDRLVNPYHQGSQIEVGGHAMGAMLSIARGVMKANTIIFVGCDYSFSLDNRFYPFDHKIDKVVMMEDTDGTVSEKPAPPPPQGTIFDIFGNTVATNGAYLGFKNVMDNGIKANKMGAMQAGEDLDFINASEGGALGALKGGNSRWMQYMRLEDAIYMADSKRKLKEGK